MYTRASEEVITVPTIPPVVDEASPKPSKVASSPSTTLPLVIARTPSVKLAVIVLDWNVVLMSVLKSVVDETFTVFKAVPSVALTIKEVFPIPKSPRVVLPLTVD